jgi:hypothetical protein
LASLCLSDQGIELTIFSAVSKRLPAASGKWYWYIDSIIDFGFRYQKNLDII